MSLVGKLNAYTCKKCGKSIITRDLEAGTTPFSLMCRATPACQGLMVSHFYSGALVNFSTKAEYEWRKPTTKEYQKASPAMKQHFDMGGLDLHRIKP